MRRRAGIAPAVVATALAGLVLAGGSSAGPPAAHGVAKARGRLVFTVRFVGPYVQGSVPFVVVRDGVGEVIVERSIRDGRATVTLPAGSYGLESYWRPCQGRCDPDDLPTDNCRRRFQVHTARRGDSETVAADATFQRGEPCRLTLTTDRPPLPHVHAGGASLAVARGPYCRAGRRHCALAGRAPRTGRALPVRTGTRVTVALRAPARRVLLYGICGHGAFTSSGGGRSWSFRVPLETLAHLRDCRNLGLQVTYGGAGIRRGVKAQFGFRLRAAR